MKNNILLIILVLAAIAVGYYFVNQKPPKAMGIGSSTTATQAVIMTPTPAPSATVQSGQFKEISITAEKWSFVPGDIKVNQGDKIRLRVKSIDVTHGLALPEYNINLTLQPGKEEVVEFTADKKGTFEFNCTVPCGPGHSDMIGKLTVV